LLAWNGVNLGLQTDLAGECCATAAATIPTTAYVRESISINRISDDDVMKSIAGRRQPPWMIWIWTHSRPFIGDAAQKSLRTRHQARHAAGKTTVRPAVPLTAP
jgi:hypothetical protein